MITSKEIHTFKLSVMEGHTVIMLQKSPWSVLQVVPATPETFDEVAALLGMVVCVAVGPLLNALSFSWGDYTLHFMLLAPAVAMTAIGGGEMAILKGTKRLRQIATTQIVGGEGLVGIGRGVGKP